MPDNCVACIRSHVETDLETNRMANGTDYSVELGIVLDEYLNNPEYAIFMGPLALGELENRIGQETGKRPSFHETKKCSVVVHNMWKEGDRAGLAEIREYVDRLLEN